MDDKMKDEKTVQGNLIINTLIYVEFILFF